MSSLYGAVNGFVVPKPRNQRPTTGLPKVPIMPLTSNYRTSPTIATTSSSATTTKTSTSLNAIVDTAVAVASLSATAKLLSSIGIGAVASKKPGLLDGVAVGALSRLTYWVFQPLFLLCSVSFTIAQTSRGKSSASGLPLWIMPLVALVQIGMGALLARLVGRVANLEEEEGYDVSMCTTFGNSGPLPLIFADALFGPGITSDVTSCISFYLLAWSPLFWSFGPYLLGCGKPVEKADNESLGAQIMSTIKQFLSPPVVGCIAGLVVGSTPFLRDALVGGWASPLYGAFRTLGGAYVPAAVLVLAGSLMGQKKPAAETSDDDDTDDDDKAAAKPTENKTASPKALMTILTSRFVLAPVMSLLSVRFLDGLGWLGTGRSRAVLRFCLLMEGCMPPAQNSVIMLQLENLPDRASKLAKTLALVYAIAVIPVTLLMSACLGISGILQYD